MDDLEAKLPDDLLQAIRYSKRSGRGYARRGQIIPVNTCNKLFVELLFFL